ncbi:MAG: tRNA pseudouridine55 synthase [Fusobacteria bacterium]|nr:MAG: tRNA pseudouridine55 synthase [Fusobacteriota bacterium]KAF0229676.1 MAG: tRNA pseudouridine55 [Fusobacteriota bacterium]
MNGIINVYKEKGMTSHDVVYGVRRILKTKKVGHAGTLDPEAEGVLVVGIGKGTRLLEYVGDGYKVYEGEIVFGLNSDTEDMHGTLEKVEYSLELLENSKLEKVFDSLSGTIISQKPPMYSSVKVKGRKLYQYARAGIEIERPSKNIEISNLLLKQHLYYENGYWRARFIAGVSKGTYIRTLCVHIGNLLGIPAVMGSLTRVQIGHFLINTSFKLEALAEMENKGDRSFLLSFREAIIDQMLQVEIDNDSYSKIKLGQKIENIFLVDDQVIFAGIYQNELVCILKNENGILRIIKNVGV